VKHPGQDEKGLSRRSEGADLNRIISAGMLSEYHLSVVSDFDCTYECFPNRFWTGMAVRLVRDGENLIWLAKTLT
jgi:hypothetical protein